MLDLTKRLVWDTITSKYKDAIGLVNNTANVGFDFPKARINVYAVTGTKTVSDPIAGVQRNVITGEAVLDPEYEDAKRDGVPAEDHSETEGRDLPKVGNPNSSKDLIKNGETYQRRYYGPYGMAETDIHYTDHNFPKQHSKVPHRHDFDWNNPGEKRGPWYNVARQFPK